MKKVQAYLIILFFCISPDLYAQVPSWEWARSANTVGKEIAYDVVADPLSNNVYVVGEWAVNLSLIYPAGANPSTDFTAPYGGIDGFVAKYDSDGIFIWAFKVGGTGNDAVTSISIDDVGDIYITGFFDTDDNYFSGTSPVTPASTLNNAAKEDFFVAKYNSDGEFQWVSRSETSAEMVKGLDVFASSSGVFVTGHYASLCTIGTLPITEVFGADDIFLIKYDQDGNEQWLIVAGSSANDYANGVTADGSNIYFTGNFKGPDFVLLSIIGDPVSSHANTNAGKEEIFIASYDLTGVFNWSHSISSTEEGFCFDIALDSDSIYITGGIEFDTYFPGYSSNPVITTNGQNIFISSHAKTDGNTGWVHAIPCTDGGNEYGYAISVSPDNELYITGYFKQDLTFPGPLTVSSIAAEDIFVAGYSSDGLFKWAINAGSSGGDYGYGISAGSGGSIFVAGSYDHLINFDLFPLPDDGDDNVFVAKLQVPCTDAIGGTITATDIEICQGESTTLTLTGYHGIITWQNSPSGMDTWTDISGETLPSVTVSPIINTDYRAYLTSDTCATDSSNIVPITVYLPPLAADAGSDQSQCDLGDFTLVGNAASVGAGTWTLISGTVTITSINSPTSTVTGVLAGTPAVLRWTIVNGTCSSFDEVSLTNDEAPTAADAGSDQSQCDLGDFTLAGNAASVGAGTWTLISGTATITSINSPTSTVTGVLAGTPAVLRWTIVNGTCSSFDEVSLTNDEAPTAADAGSDQSQCDLGDFTLAGNAASVGAGTWTLISGTATITSINSPTSTVTGVLAGTPAVLRWTIVNSTCSSFDEVSLTNDEAPTAADAGSDQSQCDLGDFTLAGNAASAGAGTWVVESGTATITTPGSETSAVTGVPAGSTAELSWTIDNGTCSTTDNVFLTNDEAPAASNAGTDQSQCNLGDFTLAGNAASAGAGTWVVESGTATITTPGSETSTVTGVPAGSTAELSWTIDNGTCSTTDNVSLTNDEAPTATDAGPRGDECDLDFAMQATPGVGTGTWTKTSGPGTETFTPDATTPDATVTVDAYGTYEFTWTEVNGTCFDDSTITVNFYEQPAANAGPGGDECDLDYALQATLSAGTGTWTKTLGPGTASFTPDAGTPNALVTVDTYGSYNFTWTEVNGICSDDSTIIVHFYEPPIADAGQDVSLCFGEESQLNASGGVTYSWSPETGLSNSNIADPIVSLTITTLYTLIITDLNGCSDQDTINVTVNPLPDIDVGEDLNICDGESVQLQASGEGTFQWDHSNMLSNSNIPNPVASPNLTTTFTVTLTDQNGCENFDELTVVVHKHPTANAGPDQELGYVFETTMEAELNSSESGEWSVVSGSGEFSNKNSPVSMVTGLSVGDNIFTWKVTNGVCPEASDEVKITVSDFLAPSVITPNGDNKNDYFVVRGIGNFDSSELIVFNRWGAEVYKNENYKNDWDGRDHNGNELPADTYFYVIKLVDGRVFKGFVVIKR